MKYEGFPENFLKLIIRYNDEGQNKRIDASALNCYQILELNWKNFVGKKLLITKKVDGRDEFEETDEGKEIKKSLPKIIFKISSR